MSAETRRNNPKSFLDHLEEFRFTLIRCLLAYAVGFAIALPCTPAVLRLLTRPLAPPHAPLQPALLQSIRVAGAFTLAMKTAGITGLLISAPLILFLLGGFIFPGLTQRERRAVLFASIGAAALFLVGIFLGYHTTLRVALQIMLQLHHWLGIVPGWTMDSYVSFCLSLLLAFGLTFQLPVIILTLGSLGILSSSLLRAKRPYVIIGLFVLAMLLTPPDVFTQLMLATPMVFLYETCIWILFFFEQNTTHTREVP
ncbi:MAG: twin-arginine translocase subunit TatC [Kiritimatiellae bacterium]|nr:twin-arginine translocase subunit TatC [Kiritimatiellia bacterium]